MSALIQCQFDYACSSWYYGLTKKSKSRLQVAQNKVIRFMLNLPPRAHIGAEQFQMVGMLPVEYRVEQLQVNHMFNIQHGHALEYLKAQFQTSLASHNTRNSIASFYVPRVNGFGKNSFKFTGVKNWNRLPIEIKSIVSKNIFKQHVKKHLMSRVLFNDQSNFIYY